MSVAALLTAARAAGLDLVPEGDSLRVLGPRPLPADLLDQLRLNKREILSTLIAPGDRYQPIDVDFELGELLGPAGARREFLQAVELVAELSNRDPWTEAVALEALAAWWGRPVKELSAAELVAGAAHADTVMGCPRPRAGDEDSR